MVTSAMATVRKELLVGLGVLAGLLAGDAISALLRRYLSGPEAKGLGFFAVSLTAYFILRFKRKARFGLFQSLGLCLLVGLVALIGELFWPGH